MSRTQPLVEETESLNEVAVIGLGYVGLPTACMLAANGVKVLGVDTNQTLVDQLLDGRPRAVEPEIRSLLGQALHSGNFHISTQLEPCGAYVISVPTPVGADHIADLSYVRAALAAVARVARRGDLLILESTVPPGTMTGVVVPELRRAGLSAGTDISVAHCPERVLPGSTLLEMVHNDRIIGAIDGASARGAQRLYSVFVKGQLHVTDLTTAEFVKVIENTYRDVNIALANEFAKLSDLIEVDVWNAIRLANNHPRVNVHKPGPGVGGHCIAVDPWFLVQLDGSRARLVKTAREVNDGMAAYVVDRLQREVEFDGGHVCLLGLAYRADLADTRESPALAVYRELQRRNIPVRAHDPLVTESIPDIANVGLTDAARGATAVLVVTDHAVFRTLDPKPIAGLMASRVAFDTRNCLDSDLWTQAGFRLTGLGLRPRESAE